MPQYWSTYLHRIRRSHDKWQDRRVRIHRDIITKSGTKFFKGEVLRVCGVIKSGTVDLTDDSGARFVTCVPLKDIEDADVWDLREKILEELRVGNWLTGAQVASRIKAPAPKVRALLKRLFQSNAVQYDGPTKRYQWVLPRPSKRPWRDKPLSTWERLAEL